MEATLPPGTGHLRDRQGSRLHATLPAGFVRDRFPTAVVHGLARHGDPIRLDPTQDDITVVVDDL